MASIKERLKFKSMTPALDGYPSKSEKIKEKYQHVFNDFPSLVLNYILSLFPILTWIKNYNFTWLYGDAVAGMTAGLVVIPQGMAYALVVGLTPEYGLYSSFVGVSIYFLFSTSKDITIGPTAVMSLLMGQNLASIQASHTDPANPAAPIVTLAVAFAFMSGIISLIIGLLRFGKILVDYISAPVIAGFTTGSALTISIGQVYKILNISGVDSKEPAYIVVGKTFKNLPSTKIDAALGITGLVCLYSIKYGTRYFAKRYPSKERAFFFIGILRNIFVVILGAVVAYLAGLGQSKNPFKILKDVPSGFTHIGVPGLDSDVLRQIAPYLPGVTIILILEHIAIAKSFGRINNYRITPSQELIAIGVTNFIGSFFGAYPATGSFSRSAIKSKSGVRTPLADIFSAILVMLALYVLTPAFYYIPDAVLSAVIFHAVLDLISSPEYVFQLWEAQFWDFLVFVVAVVFTFFFTVEYGIYFSVALSTLVLLVRLARPKYESLGRIKLDDINEDSTSGEKYAYAPLESKSFKSITEPPPDGVLIFRIDEALIYPNASYIDDQILDYAKSKTRRIYKPPSKKGDRPWNDSSYKDDNQEQIENSNKPLLKAVVFDFVAISSLDSTGLQSIIDIREELDRYSGHKVEYHFANVLSKSIKKSLIYGGFGQMKEDEKESSAHVPTKENKDLEKNIIDSPQSNEVITIINNEEDNSEHDTISIVDNKKQKNFFHFTLPEAVSAATDGAW
nr:8490_t:CDS:2 [Entrophospora candida]